MRLHPLLATLGRHSGFLTLVESLRTPSHVSPRVLSAITPARAFALAGLHAASRRPMLLVTGRPSEARVYANELRAWAADPDAVLLYPETDALPYDRLPSDPDKLTERLTALEHLSGLQKDRSTTPPLIVASIRAAMDLVLEPDVFRDSHRVVRRGESLPPSELAADAVNLDEAPAAKLGQKIDPAAALLQPNPDSLTATGEQFSGYWAP